MASVAVSFKNREYLGKFPVKNAVFKWSCLVRIFKDIVNYMVNLLVCKSEPMAVVFRSKNFDKAVNPEGIFVPGLISCLKSQAAWPLALRKEPHSLMLQDQCFPGSM